MTTRRRGWGWVLVGMAAMGTACWIVAVPPATGTGQTRVGARGATEAGLPGEAARPGLVAGAEADPSLPADSVRVFRSGVGVSDWIRPEEVHFQRLWQLTDGGENAEAYFSWDGKDLILQSTPRGANCDQIYTLSSAGGEMTLVSTGGGRCTCSYFLPGDREVVFSSTHQASPDCPPRPDLSRGYVWALYRGYDIFRANRDGSNLHRLTDDPGYDAEATAGPDGSLVFTSDRTGDLELYRMKADGSGVKQLTFTPGYDGGAFFSADGKRICYRAARPKDPQKLREYRGLLHEGLIRPSELEIFVMNADGSKQVQLTENGAANFCPFFQPGRDRIIFSSNVGDPKKRDFNLFLVDIETKKVEQVTFEPTFDGFPMFSLDGKRLVFASNRGAKVPGETNIFIAEWKD